MLKFIGIFFIIILFLSFFTYQTRDYLNEHIQNIFFKEAQRKAKERQIIGAVDVYSPRVEEIQLILKNTGIFLGPVDGLMGRRTRQAIKVFQKQKGLEPSGIIDEKTYSFLLKERERQNFLLQKSNLGGIDYSGISLEGIPKLEKSSEEFTKIAGPQQNLELPKDKNKQIQFALKKAGFYAGPIDGKIGAKTRLAIKKFQKLNGLKPDGIVGPKTWEKLKRYLN